MPDGIAFYNPLMSTPLHHECSQLVARGLHPVVIVAYARSLACIKMLEVAFPTMPAHTRDCLMAGTSVLIHDQFFNWILVHRDAST